MAEEFIEIHWTSGSLEEAREIARALVEGRHVACAQIVPAIESVYIWENEVETAQESKVVFKTLANKFDIVKELIKERASYDVPEVTQVAIVGGSEDYLNWMKEVTSTT